jgi:hypothetical protein
MIWIVLGILSIFWDPVLGEYVPILPLYIFGAFWKRHSIIIAAIILYLHHVTLSSSGVEEILLFSLLITATSLDEILDLVVSYISLSSAVSIIFLISFGLIDGIIYAVFSVVVYFLLRPR